MKISEKIYAENALKWFKAGKELAQLAHFAESAEAIFYSKRRYFLCTECGEGDRLMVDPFDDSECHAIAWDCACGNTEYVNVDV